MSKLTEQPNITLFRGWLDRGQYVWSPFVTKLEARLRFGGINYTTDAGSVQSAPKGKIPYIECHRPHETIAIGDSSLITKELVEWGLLPNLNASLGPEKAALDLSLRALFEDKLYFYHTRERWIDNYYTMRDHVLWSVPYPVRIIVGLLVHRKHSAMLEGQGTGRFSNEELRGFKHEIWSTLDTLLGASKARTENGPFWVLGGEAPTEADTTVFGTIVSVLFCTAGPDSQVIVRGYPNVLEYAIRIHDKYFPDYIKWTES